MKKIFLFVVTMFIFSNCYALEYKYSEWSPIYPGSVKDKIFIEEEDRFLWYKDVEKDVSYKRIEQLNGLDKYYDMDDFKYETGYSFPEPTKYKERTYKEVRKENYVFKNSDIDNLVLMDVDNIDIDIIELYRGDESVYYYDKDITKSFFIVNKITDFDETYKIVIYYSSRRDEKINVAYRADNYNVYQKDIKFGECDECKVEVKISDLRAYQNQSVHLYEYTDKVYKTYDIERVYTDDYYSSMEDGYIKDEKTLRKYYRFIMNDYIIVSRDGRVVHDDDECLKESCLIRYQDKEEEIENPKTGDSIYLYGNALMFGVVLLLKKLHDIIKV